MRKVCSHWNALRRLVVRNVSKLEGGVSDTNLTVLGVSHQFIVLVP